MKATSAVKIVHEGCASIRIEVDGRVIRFDPCTPPAPGELAVVTWNEQERLQGSLEAIESGARPHVAATGVMLEWLSRLGSFHLVRLPSVFKDIRIESLIYRPVPYATPSEGLRKLRSAVLDPPRAGRRIWQRLWLPSCPPAIFHLTLPDGRRLLHLNCSLHRWTEPDWLEETVARFGGADLVIAGIDYEEDPAFLERIERFQPGLLLVADLIHDVRRKLDLIDEPMEPYAERLRERGIETRALESGQTVVWEPSIRKEGIGGDRGASGPGLESR